MILKSVETSLNILRHPVQKLIAERQRMDLVRHVDVVGLRPGGVRRDVEVSRNLAGKTSVNYALGEFPSTMERQLTYECSIRFAQFELGRVEKSV